MEPAVEAEALSIQTRPAGRRSMALRPRRKVATPNRAAHTARPESREEGRADIASRVTVQSLTAYGRNNTDREAHLPHTHRDLPLDGTGSGKSTFPSSVM